jgi:hypothetical protein
MAVWLSPVPIEIPVAIFTSLLLSRLTSMTGSSALFSILRRTGNSSTAAIRNGQEENYIEKIDKPEKDETENKGLLKSLMN